MNEDTEDTPVSPSPPEATDAPSEPAKPAYRITEKPQPPATPLLNRAQRRQLRKYIRHKAAVQMRHVFAENARKPWMHMTRQDNRCNRCKLWSIPAPAPYRCQCQVEHRRQCRLCGVDCMASQQAWKQTNVCLACAAQIELQRESEEGGNEHRFQSL